LHGFKKSLIGEFSLKRLVWWLVIIPFLVYLGLGIFAYFFADKLIFQPQPSFYRDDESILKLVTPGGEKISAKFFRNPTAEFTILFSHGNAEDIGSSGFYFEELSDAEFNVFAYDYRGYGTGEGQPSEQNSYQDAETAYNYLTGELKIPAEKIIIYGRSLGGAVSIELASRKNCGGLIVESSFISSFRVLTRYPMYPFDRFQSISNSPYAIRKICWLKLLSATELQRESSQL
jgi:hypothetical protein